MLNLELNSKTELYGHPSNCGCIECQAWREFRPMWNEYTDAKTSRLWEIYVRAFIRNEPGAREEFYSEVPMNRQRRRALEAKARKLNGKRK